MHVSGAHNSPVTCLEWSPDGELLYSGDVQGKVYVTVVKLQEVNNNIMLCTKKNNNKHSINDNCLTIIPVPPSWRLSQKPMRPKAKWAIDSEARRMRGIMVL